jgi:serine kinase of HPr protein (carbohydrate metabolism regulator)
MLVHASCAARAGHGVLLLGPPGSGKSDLLLRLLGEGFDLVADDQVRLAARAEGLMAAPPPAVAGLLEVRGLGLLTGLGTAGPVPLRLAVRLVPPAEVPRLPEPATVSFLGREVPALSLAPFEASAARKLALALDVVLGHRALVAGAIAPAAAPATAA